MKNELDDSMIYIGFGNEEGYHLLTSSNKISFRYVVGFKKEEIKLRQRWEYDFQVHTYDAICYYCSSKLQSPAGCKFEMTFNTWGSKRSIHAQTYQPDSGVGPKYSKFSSSDLYSGYLPLKTFDTGVVNILIWLLPTFGALFSMLFLNTQIKDVLNNPIAAVIPI